jgi:hypothetical protein
VILLRKRSCTEFVEIDMRNPSPSPPRFPYINTPGENLNFDEEAIILHYFEYFFDAEILELITTETNRCAAQCLRIMFFFFFFLNI